MTRRTDRIGNLIQREIGSLIQTEVGDSRIGFVTISRVDVTPDLSLARVHVSVYGDESSQKRSMAGLKSSAPHLRTLLAKSLHIKTVPKLEFQLDLGLERSDRIHSIIKNIDTEAPEESAMENDRERGSE